MSASINMCYSASRELIYETYSPAAIFSIFQEFSHSYYLIGVFHHHPFKPPPFTLQNGCTIPANHCSRTPPGWLFTNSTIAKSFKFVLLLSSLPPPPINTRLENRISQIPRADKKTKEKASHAKKKDKERKARHQFLPLNIFSFDSTNKSANVRNFVDCTGKKKNKKVSMGFFVQIFENLISHSIDSFPLKPRWYWCEYKKKNLLAFKKKVPDYNWKIYTGCLSIWGCLQ